LKYIDFTEEQFREDDGYIKNNPLFRGFIHEYQKVCDRRADFSHRLREIIRKEDSSITKNNVQKLIKSLEPLEDSLYSFFGRIKLPDIIFFTGTRAWDGHGVNVYGRFYVFFNMSILNMIMDKPGFHTDVHNLHEIIHAIHYTFYPEFYPGNYGTIEEEYLNKMIAEGIATYISGVLTHASPGDSLCFGLMNESDFKEWIDIARNSKGEIWRSIKKCIRTGNNDENLLSRLYYMPGGSLKNGRFGYFYGMEIADLVGREHGNKGIMSMSMEQYKKYIEEYFKD